jgi:hypothetical protein
MLKKYSFEQLENFYKGYDAVPKPHFQSKFNKSITLALCEIYDLVTSEDYSDQTWQRGVAENHHNWLSFDLESRMVIYDTGFRDETWSNEIVDRLFDNYDYVKVKNFYEEKTTQKFLEEYRVIKEYYDCQGFFARIFSTGVEGLTLEGWKRVKSNKYAIKVMDTYRAKPLFSVGEIVSIRKSQRECTKDKYSNKITYMIPSGVDKVLILSNSEPILNARKGARRYKVAPIGGTAVFWIEEGSLKKLKKSKNKTNS